MKKLLLTLIIGIISNSFVWAQSSVIVINPNRADKSQALRDIVKTYHPESVRLFLLSHHYRSPVDFTDQAVKNVAVGLDKIYALLERAEKYLGTLPGLDAENHAGSMPEKNTWELFCQAMSYHRQGG